MDPKQRLKSGQRASLTGLLCNVCLFLVKFLLGLFSHSVAVTADAFNNLSDCLSSAVSLLSVRLSMKPADADHPYGHGRAEYIASFLVSLLILLFGLDLLRSSLERFLHPEAISFTPITFLLLFLSILVKVSLFFYYRSVARKTGLQVLSVSARDSLFDCISTALSLLALSLHGLVTFDLDAVAGILLSLLILYSAIQLLRESATPLLGRGPDTALSENLRSLAESDPRVLGVHDVRLHDYGYRQEIGSMHIELPEDLSFHDTHAIADRLEEEAKEKYGVDLVIHTDPVTPDTLQKRKLKEDVIHIHRHTDIRLSLHDFQPDFTRTPPHLSFDLLLPYA
ncbi:MAG: cation transporter, partial [Clostridia bacterium]|nr:cation transporter [Clostridia bacterium]